jgi:hypothetical protein
MRGSRARRLAVELRIQRGVIVHLELKIDRKGALPRDDFREQDVQATREICALHPNARKFFATLLPMFRRRVRSRGFLVHMEFLERENRQTVDHHPRGFGITGTPRSWRLENGHDCFIHFLNEVVPLLVETIDVSLRPVNRFKPQIVATRYVLFVPQLEIAKVVLLDQKDQTVAFGSRLYFVPARGESGLQGCDLGRGNCHEMLGGKLS